MNELEQINATNTLAFINPSDPTDFSEGFKPVMRFKTLKTDSLMQYRTH